VAFDHGSTQFLSPLLIRLIVEQLAGDQDNLAKAGEPERNAGVVSRMDEVLVNCIEFFTNRDPAYLLVAFRILRVVCGGAKSRESDSGCSVTPGPLIDQAPGNQTPIGPIALVRVEDRVIMVECPAAGFQEIDSPGCPVEFQKCQADSRRAAGETCLWDFPEWQARAVIRLWDTG